jgi:hypothetical protein
MTGVGEHVQHPQTGQLGPLHQHLTVTGRVTGLQET